MLLSGNVSAHVMTQGPINGPLENCCNQALTLIDTRPTFPARYLRSTSEVGNVMDTGPQGAMKPSSSDYLLVSTMGIRADSCKLIRRSMRRSTWYHNAVFFGEITFSNTGTYFIRNAMSCCSTSVDLLM
jgi:hypothetical protein